MDAQTTLQELARQVRRDTLQILQGAQPSWLTYATPGTSNHILWHAGHALWLQDLLCIQLLAGQRELPRSWDEMFGMNCRPPAETLNWPDRASMAAQLQQQLVRILALLQAATDEQLARTADPVRGPATVAERIIHGLHDEAKHSGEMYLLLKLCRTRAHDL